MNTIASRFFSLWPSRSSVPDSVSFHSASLRMVWTFRLNLINQYIPHRFNNIATVVVQCRYRPLCPVSQSVSVERRRRVNVVYQHEKNWFLGQDKWYSIRFVFMSLSHDVHVAQPLASAVAQWGSDIMLLICRWSKGEMIGLAKVGPKTGLNVDVI